MLYFRTDCQGALWNTDVSLHIRLIIYVRMYMHCTYCIVQVQDGTECWYLWIQATLS